MKIDTAHFSGESGVLRRLLALMMAPDLVIPCNRLFMSGELAKAAVTYFLLDTQLYSNVETFITYTLGRLIRQLNRSTQQYQIEYQGRIQGRIVWPSTLKARYSQNLDPTCYVCREVRHQYDTPQNQLLKFMVERLGDCLEMIPTVLRNGGCYRPASETMTTVHTKLRLERMEVALNAVRRHAKLQEVTLPHYIDELHILRAETARIEEYAELARIYKHYQKIIELSSWEQSWEQICKIGTRVLVLPEYAGNGGEPWVQLAVNILQGRL